MSYDGLQVVYGFMGRSSSDRTGDADVGARARMESGP